MIRILLRDHPMSVFQRIRQQVPRGALADHSFLIELIPRESTHQVLSCQMKCYSRSGLKYTMLALIRFCSGFHQLLSDDTTELAARHSIIINHTYNRPNTGDMHQAIGPVEFADSLHYNAISSFG